MICTRSAWLAETLWTTTKAPTPFVAGAPPATSLTPFVLVVESVGAVWVSVFVPAPYPGGGPLSRDFSGLPPCSECTLLFRSAVHSLSTTTSSTSASSSAGTISFRLCNDVPNAVALSPVLSSSADEVDGVDLLHAGSQRPV